MARVLILESVSDFLLPCSGSSCAQETQLREELRVLREDTRGLQTKYDAVVARAENAERAVDQSEQARPTVFLPNRVLLNHTIIVPACAAAACCDRRCL